MYEVGDVIETSGWDKQWNGLYVILRIDSAIADRPITYICRQIFCGAPINGARSFTAGLNEKIGHIDDISSLAAEV